MKKFLQATLIIGFIVLMMVLTVIDITKPRVPEIYSWGPTGTGYTILLKDDIHFSDNELTYAPEANLVITIKSRDELIKYIDMYSESCTVFFMTQESSKLNNIAKTF